MILSYQHLLAFSSDADIILHRALEMRLIYWECQKEGKSWGRAATGFRHLLQHRKCEFLYMPPLGHGGTTVLETSPRTKAASLALRGGETAWHPCWPSHQRVADTVSAIFIIFLVSEVYHQEANSRGQSCAGRGQSCASRAVLRWGALTWVGPETSSFLVPALPPRCCTSCLSSSPAHVHQP